MRTALTAAGGMLLGILVGIVFGNIVIGMIVGLLLGAIVEGRRGAAKDSQH